MALLLEDAEVVTVEEEVGDSKAKGQKERNRSLRKILEGKSSYPKGGGKGRGAFRRGGTPNRITKTTLEQGK